MSEERPETGLEEAAPEAHEEAPSASVPEAGEDSRSTPPMLDPAQEQELRRRLEAVLFVSSDPLSVRKLAELTDAPDSRVARRLLEDLAREYRERDGGLAIEDVAGGYQLLTRPEQAPWVERYLVVRRDSRLSPAALETLAIIAYKQPVTRAEVDAIRGVAAGPVLKTLMDRGFVRVVGRSEAPGRPVQYGSTAEFLKHFGLRSLGDLPKNDTL